MMILHILLDCIWMNMMLQNRVPSMLVPLVVILEVSDWLKPEMMHFMVLLSMHILMYIIMHVRMHIMMHFWVYFMMHVWMYFMMQVMMLSNMLSLMIWNSNCFVNMSIHRVVIWNMMDHFLAV